MSDEQETIPEANAPKPIRIDKRSLFTPSEAVAVEQHSTTPHVSRTRYGTARIEGRLSSPNARVPAVISQHCGGITVKGHTLKSFAYTTDAAIIRNTNANAILAVYPFTGEPVITQALLTVAQMPLFVGVGGGTTTGPRVTELAMVAEMQGAAGVVINAPAPAETIETTMSMVDIPVIANSHGRRRNHRMQDSRRCGHHQRRSRSTHRASRGKHTCASSGNTDPGIGRRIRRSHPRHHRSGRGCHHMDAAKRATAAIADDGEISRRSLIQANQKRKRPQRNRKTIQENIPIWEWGVTEACRPHPTPIDVSHCHHRLLQSANHGLEILILPALERIQQHHIHLPRRMQR